MEVSNGVQCKNYKMFISGVQSLFEKSVCGLLLDESVCVEAIWWLMLLKHTMTSVVNNIHAESMNYKPPDIFILQMPLKLSDC